MSRLPPIGLIPVLILLTDVCFPYFAAEGKDEPTYEGKPLHVWLEEIKHNDPKVREKAAKAMGEMGPQAEAAVPALLAALEDSEPPVRSAAIQALGAIGRPAVAPLIDLLKHKEIPVRGNAALALGRIGPRAKAAVPALIMALPDESNAFRF